MKRKIRYLFRILWNSVRIPLLTVLNFGRLKGTPFQIVSPAAKLRTDKGGSITLKGRVVIEEGTLIDACGGNIVLENCFINRNCTVVSMGSIRIVNATIGPGTCIYDHDHDGNGGYIFKAVQIDSNAWVGANAVILKGAEISESAVVAAGSIVTKSIPPFSIVGGVPAKVIKYRYHESNAVDASKHRGEWV